MYLASLITSFLIDFPLYHSFLIRNQVALMQLEWQLLWSQTTCIYTLQGINSLEIAKLLFKCIKKISSQQTSHVKQALLCLMGNLATIAHLGYCWENFPQFMLSQHLSPGTLFLFLYLVLEKICLCNNFLNMS